MKTFLEYYHNIFEIGAIEKIDIPQFQLHNLSAKVDSGNDAYNVLHGDNIQVNGDMVEFDTVEDVHIQTKIVDQITINVGAGNNEDRPVVLFDIILGGKKFKNVPFSIGNRGDNEQPILIGKPFIANIGALINVNKEEVL